MIIQISTAHVHQNDLAKLAKSKYHAFRILARTALPVKILKTTKTTLANANQDFSARNVTVQDRNHPNLLNKLNVNTSIVYPNLIHVNIMADVLHNSENNLSELHYDRSSVNVRRISEEKLVTYLSLVLKILVPESTEELVNQILIIQILFVNVHTEGWVRSVVRRTHVNKRGMFVETVVFAKIQLSILDTVVNAPTDFMEKSVNLKLLR